MKQVENYRQEKLLASFAMAKKMVEKSYLSDLGNGSVLPIDQTPYAMMDPMKHVRLYQFSKLVYDKEESILDKLSSVFHAVGNAGGSLILIVENHAAETHLYIGTKTHNSAVGTASEAFEKSFHGHFPGCGINLISNRQVNELIGRVMDSPYPHHQNAVSVVSGIPSLKTEKGEPFIQGLEKFMDAMQGEVFSAVFIADVIPHDECEKIKMGYEMLYSQLSPFLKIQWNIGENESVALTEGMSLGFSKTLNESLTKTHSYTYSTSQSDSYSENESESKSKAPLVSLAAAGIGLLFGGPMGATAGSLIGGQIGALMGTQTKGSATSSASTEGGSEGKSHGIARGVSISDSEQHNQSETRTSGRSKSVQIQSENKSVAALLNKIDEQLERMRGSQDFGMWNAACYFVAADLQIAQVAASTFKAMIRGEHSAVEDSHIHTWFDGPDLEEVTRYLKKLSHPLIHVTNPDQGRIAVTPGSLVHGQEIPIMFGLPRKSIRGLPVLKSAEFGRNVITYDSPEASDLIPLGKIFHMGKAESTEVSIHAQSLVSHTLICGSTGSGKSNSMYLLLDELHRRSIPFLVIEPAKGEYRHAARAWEGIQVFGTNPSLGNLLKLNPFRFPESIHVLEHIDRLIEIFNACWPMYAAMPAVLKDSMERVYEEAGWDLDLSVYLGEEARYPSFHDLLNSLRAVITESDFSEEVKSNYIGALLTRIKSLTNGLNRNIFSAQGIPWDVMFGQNCLVDLSRIGSTETKSLIMGILFMQLQEYRMSEQLGPNQPLRHVTVLEEAHHLLRRTAYAQQQDQANLQGKSVEMITNAIAEMRSYGEGFIIVDQSPASLDPAVIRNTNMKIMFRLPDENDRREVGNAASLTDEQLKEIPRLKTGVAVIYQNNWMQPVLCQINHFPLGREGIQTMPVPSESRKMLGQLCFILLHSRVPPGNRVWISAKECTSLREWIGSSSVLEAGKPFLLEEIDRYGSRVPLQLWDQTAFPYLSSIVSRLVKGNKLLAAANRKEDFHAWNEAYIHALRKYVDLKESDPYEKALMQCLLYEKAKEQDAFTEFYFKWVEEGNRI